MNGWKRESGFTRKFGRNNPWGGHRRYALTPRQFLLTVGGILAAMLVCGVLLIVLGQVKVKSVEIKGNSLYSSQTILEVAGITEGGGYFDYDPASVEDELREKLPVIRKADVRRKLGGKVEILVEEETGFYYTWHNQNCYLLSDETLRVLFVSDNSGEYRKLGAVYLGLPADARVRVGEVLSFAYRTSWENADQVETRDEDKPAEKQYEYVLDTLKIYRKSDLASRTVGLDLTDPYNVYVILKGKVRIDFASYDELDEKISEVIPVLMEEQRYDATGDTTVVPMVVNAESPSKISVRYRTDAPWPSWALD